MSPVNYWLELPTQWRIHPVFHIDLLTLYRETIMHGANYQHPPPDLVNNAKEYKVEKILDSWLFSRRWRLQYLVKWKGYPDSDNMWVNKDDMFTDDKLRTFKESNPDARTHLRAIQSTIIPHSPLASSRVSSTSYYTPHILSMSSDGCSDLPSDPQHSAQRESFSPPPGPRSGSPGDAEIIKAIRLLRIGTPPINLIEFAKTTSILAHPRPLTPFTRHADGHRVVSGTTHCSQAADGQAEPSKARHRDDSSHPDYELDDRHCARCDGPMEYCHGHDTPNPIPIPAPVAPIFVRPPATPQHREMARVHLTHVDVATLAAQIA